MVKIKLKCTGCGEDRPCYLEVNQERWDDYADDLKCVLDETNQTSYNWKEIGCEIAAKGPSDNPLY